MSRRTPLDRWVVALASLLWLAPGCSRDGDLELARELCRKYPLIDGHIDVPYRLTEQQKRDGKMDDVAQATAGGEFDHPRAIAGGLDAFFQSIYTPSSMSGAEARSFADSMIDLVEGIAMRAPEKFAMLRTAADVRALHAEHAGRRVGFLLGMENGGPIGEDLGALDHFFARGVRYVTLCHDRDNQISDSSYDERRTNRGLSEFGREVVDRMNRLGILIDVSHVSDDAFYQVIARTKAPLIASHSSARRYTPFFERNLDDDMLRLLRDNGGVVMINFGSTFVDDVALEFGKVRMEAFAAQAKERGIEPDSDAGRALRAEIEAATPFPFATVEQVADHFDHVVEIAGIDHVGLGSDFDGVGDTLPIGLKDVSQYPNLIAELLRREYDEASIAKILGGNVLRVLERAEQVAAELSRG
jgi:membrane dipeptidase